MSVSIHINKGFSVNAAWTDMVFLIKNPTSKV